MAEPKSTPTISTPPLLSIVVPTYNCQEFIPQILQTIHDQTYLHWECLFVDDGSTDQTPQLLKLLCEKHQRFQLIEKKHEGLPAKSRNLGIKLARGEFIAFLDHDDLWSPTKNEKQIAFFENDPALNMIITDHDVFHNQYSFAKLREFRINLSPSHKTRKSLLRKLLKQNFIALPSVMIKKKHLEKYGYFKEQTSFRVGEDYQLWLKIAADEQIGWIKSPLTHCRQHANNITKDRSLMVKGLYAIANDIEQENGPTFIVNHIRSQALKSDAVSILKQKPDAAIYKLYLSLMLRFRIKPILIMGIAVVFLVIDKLQSPWGKLKKRALEIAKYLKGKL